MKYWILMIVFLFQMSIAHAQCPSDAGCSLNSADLKQSIPSNEDIVKNISENRQHIASQSVNLCSWGMCIGKTKTSAEGIAQNIIRFLARTISSLAVLAFMAGGFLMIIRIDDEGRAKAKKIMTSSVIAVIVVLSSYVLVTFIQQVLYSLGK